MKSHNENAKPVSVACIVFMRGKVLIAKRTPTGDMGGRWEFPGGKVETGENVQDAIAREMREEFDVLATVKAKIGEVTFTHRAEERRLVAYLVKFDRTGEEPAPFKLTEHVAYRWVEIDEITQYNFVDSDKKIYSIVKRFIENITDSF